MKFERLVGYKALIADVTANQVWLHCGGLSCKDADTAG
jgi:hypothetical protein